MNKLILISLCVVSFQVWASKTAVPPCAVCTKVDAIVKSNEEDEGKAYNDFNELVGTVKLSANKKVLSAELKSIIMATPTFLKNDDRRELPSYLVDMEGKNPQEFAAAMKELPAEQKEDLERKIQAARKNMKDGEEP